jgi:hypothetical protein
MALTTINSDGVKDDSIVNADIKSDAAIALSKLASTPAVLTGSTDNTITTVTGANAIQGEANLTFDGNYLTLDTSASSRIYLTSGNSNDSSIYFGAQDDTVTGGIRYDHSDDSLRLYGNNNSEKFRIDSSGRVLIGNFTTNIGDGTLQVYTADKKHPAIRASSSTANGYAMFSDAYGIDESQVNIGVAYSTGSLVLSTSVKVSDTAADTYLSSQDSFAVKPCALTMNHQGELSFLNTTTSAATTTDTAVSLTESFSIQAPGNAKISCNKGGDYALHAQNDGDNSNRYGILIQCGADDAAGTNYALGVADGDGGTQGYLTFTGGTLSLVAFTAAHPCIIPDADNPSDNSMAYPYGTLLETISIQYSQKNGADTERGIRYKVQKTQSANSRKVLGAYAGSMNGGPEGQTNEHDVYVLGDGHILVNNAGGNIEVGDGICSSATAGIGQKATANPSMIIGIAQEAITFTGSETKLVAVQYGLQQFIPWT